MLNGYVKYSICFWFRKLDNRKKLTELGEFIISEIALPLGVLVIIGLGITIMKGNSGQFTGYAVKAVAGLTVIVAAASIAAWIIGK